MTTIPEIADGLIAILMLLLGWFARDAYGSLKRDQAAIWTHINDKLVTKDLFTLQTSQTNATLGSIDRKLDVLTDHSLNHRSSDG